MPLAIVLQTNNARAPGPGLEYAGMAYMTRKEVVPLHTLRHLGNQGLLSQFAQVSLSMLDQTDDSPSEKFSRFLGFQGKRYTEANCMFLSCLHNFREH